MLNMTLFARKHVLLIKNLQNMLGKTPKNPQLNIFEIPLISFINLDHEICVLSRNIDWDNLENELSPLYSHTGQPSVPIRKIVGLLLLKQIYNLGDETVIERWIENPYWQYFCGEVNFQKNSPFDPSDFVHFRKRIGKHGAELLLKLSIQLHGIKSYQENEVLIDTTVQEKNITYPTDSKLQKKIIDKCLKIADDNNIELRQTYRRVVPKLMQQQRHRKHPKTRKKSLAAGRKIKTIAGRLVREIERKLPEQELNKHAEIIDRMHNVLKQERNSKNKIYSLHEPDVLCIAKGKEHKPFEFGNKSSFVRTRYSGVIVGAMAFKENIYDGHTLAIQLDQVENLTNHRPDTALVDQGYRGKKKIGITEIIYPKSTPKNANQYQRTKRKKQCKARSAIEPIISHLKYDHRMLRNYLKGTIGDAINTILAATAFNLKKLLNQIRDFLLNFIKLIITIFFTEKVLKII